MTNLQKKLSEKLEQILAKGAKMLLSGKLYDFEQWLNEQTQEIYKEILSEILTQIGTSVEFMKILGKQRCALGLGRLKRKRVKIQIRTGEYIEYISYYAERGGNISYSGTFHLSLLYWHCLKKASPSYYSTAGLLSILCPSFEIAVQLLSHFGIKGNYNRIRDLSILLGTKGQQMGVSAVLESEESLAGKRVVVSADGGRSRTREYTGQVNEKGNAKYDTPWKEPKVFVIQILDKEGQVEKKVTFPIYGATMGDIKVFWKKLKQVLTKLNIHQAKEVQFIADGAPCFWNKIRQFFIELGLKPKKMTYTLDYYHGVEHLQSLVNLLPIKQEDNKNWFRQFKDFLWDGAIYSIQKRVLKSLESAGQTMSEELKTALDYFIRHTDHMQYYKFKKAKWLCGSGLMESAIRRIINLRFKGSSSFWLVKNLEPLLFLRCAFLAGRWKFFITNLLAK